MQSNGRRVPRRIAVISSNVAPWGGSEELWKDAAVSLAKTGHRVTVYKARLARNAEPRKELETAGCTVIDLARPLHLREEFYNILSLVSRLAGFAVLFGRLWLGLWLRRPDAIVLSQGGNFDGVHFSRLIRKLGIPYFIISQKASELYWPSDSERDRVRMFYREAVHAFFVSKHNWRLTEEQIGERIERASVARNPFLVSFEGPLAWPEGNDTVDFACIGRLYPMEKGQDLVLQVLARQKWRDRPVRVTFYGEGINRQGLEGMAEFLGLGNVTFAGQVKDIESLWRSHQVLLLASRAEGLPLVVVETMLAGRVVITTDAGGSAEAFEDNVTGFLAAAPTVESLDEAMERAWMQRERWKEIGQRAASSIREIVPQEPGATLAREIENLIPIRLSEG